jgi:hypothetical protein
MTTKLDAMTDDDEEDEHRSSDDDFASTELTAEFSIDPILVEYVLSFKRWMGLFRTKKYWKTSSLSTL